MKIDIDINSISQTAFLSLQCHAIDAQSIKPILSDFSSLKTLKIIRSNIEDHKSKLYRKLKKSKVKKNLVKLTVKRASKYDLYMKKFQPKGTCQCNAIDVRSIELIRPDFSLLKTLKIFRSNIADQKSKLYRKLKANKVKTSLVKYTVLRANQYDRYIKKFIQTHPKATVVNIGCGLDNRFERVDNGSITFIDIDLPDIINIKSQLFTSSERYLQVSSSVFDDGWMKLIKTKQVIFVDEGVFMYCSEKDIKSLLLTLKEKFPGSEIVFEVFNSKWLKGWRKKIMDFKLKKELKFGDGASFKFGISDSDEIEGWNKGFNLISDWSYLESDELNSSILKLFRKSDTFKKVLWTVHYKLNRI